MSDQYESGQGSSSNVDTHLTEETMGIVRELLKSDKKGFVEAIEGVDMEIQYSEPHDITFYECSDGDEYFDAYSKSLNFALEVPGESSVDVEDLNKHPENDIGAKLGDKLVDMGAQADKAVNEAFELGTDIAHDVIDVGNDVLDVATDSVGDLVDSATSGLGKMKGVIIGVAAVAVIGGLAYLAMNKKGAE